MRYAPECVITGYIIGCGLNGATKGAIVGFFALLTMLIVDHFTRGEA